MNRVSLLLSLAGHAGLAAAVAVGSSGPEEAAGRGRGEMVWVSLVVPGAVAMEGHAGPTPVTATEGHAGPTPVTATGGHAKPRPVAPPSSHSLLHVDPPRPVPVAAPPTEIRAPRSVAAPPGSGGVSGVQSQPERTSSGATASSAGPSVPAAVPGAGRGRASRWPGPDAVDRAARPRWPIRPDYPSAARRAGLESMVTLEAWVDEAGVVDHVSVLESGGEPFDASARRAVERTAFRPARLGGRDAASRVALRVHFRLYE